MNRRQSNVAKSMRKNRVAFNQDNGDQSPSASNIAVDTTRDMD